MPHLRRWWAVWWRAPPRGRSCGFLLRCADRDRCAADPPAVEHGIPAELADQVGTLMRGMGWRKHGVARWARLDHGGDRIRRRCGGGQGARCSPIRATLPALSPPRFPKWPSATRRTVRASHRPPREPARGSEHPGRSWRAPRCGRHADSARVNAHQRKSPWIRRKRARRESGFRPPKARHRDHRFVRARARSTRDPRQSWP